MEPSIQKRFVYRIILLVIAIGNRVQGKAHITQVPPSPLYIASGRTASFVWDYTVDNRTREFQLLSPAWKYYFANGEAVDIGHENSLLGCRWNISFATCPSRLLNPTIRVSKESTATLVIANVTTADSGIYGMVLMLNNGDPITSTVRLLVTTKPKITSNFPASSIILEYRDLNISCSAVGIPTPNITWVLLKDQTKEIKSQGVGYAELFIPNITRHQNGTYQCQATNKPNEYPVEKQTKVTVWYKPHMVILNWTVNKKIILLCLVSGQPYPVSTWYYPSGTQVHLGIKEIPGGSKLVIEVQEHNASLYGLYACNATNHAGWQVGYINISQTNHPTTRIVTENEVKTTTDSDMKMKVPSASSEVSPTIITRTTPTSLKTALDLNNKDEERAKRKIILKYVLLCGFGVLLPIAITISVIIFLKRRWKQRRDKENRTDTVDDSNIPSHAVLPEASNIVTYEEVTNIPIYAKVDGQKKLKDKRNDQMPIYAQINKKKKKRPDQVIYAELEDINSSTTATCVNRPPPYIATEYAEIKKPDRIYDTLPDIV